MDEVYTYTKKFSKLVTKKIKKMVVPPKPEPPVEIAFMTCIVRVDVGSRGWQKAVLAVLKSSKGVRSFKMDDYGHVEVSGTVNPNVLLKSLAKSGKKAELCWFQFGQCSSNLFVPDRKISHGYGGYNNYYNRDGTFLQYRGYGGRPQFRSPYSTMDYNYGVGYMPGPTTPALGGENFNWF